MIGRRVVYSEPQDVFFQDILKNNILRKIQMNTAGIENIVSEEPTSMSRSLRNSPVAIKNLLELSGVKNTHVTFEYLLPYTQRRIDCMLYGRNSDNKGYVIHIELKQWDSVVATNIDGNFVETYTGRPNNIVPHPSQQVKGYHDYLIGFVEVFEEKELEIYGCAYCHNYDRVEGIGLHDPIYKDVYTEYPVYSANDVEDLAEKVNQFLGNGDGYSVFNKFMQSPVKPSKKLLESAAKIISNESDFALLNDQIVARNVILAKIKNAERKNEKSIVLIKGGPGTGKTVIALHVLAQLANSKKQKAIFFSTKSKPLLEGIKNRLPKGSDAKLLFTNLNQFIPSRVDKNSVDVLIIDEAHRIGKTSNHQYTKAIDRTDLSQIETLIQAAKTSIFFIDDKQVIRSAEIGSTDLIKQYAERLGCVLEEVELVSQFRCNGSENYLDWIEASLGYSSEKRVLKKEDNYDFKVFSSPHELYSALTEKNNGTSVTSRLVAGFCWEWSKKLDENGQLVKDVRIGDFAMPWETHGDITKPPPGYVKWYEWAYKPEGIKQVGCIYTAQGFEFDYIGVIVGNDLKYDKNTDSLYGDISATKDPTLRRGKEQFDAYVKNIYRVLMTRGMKGCYVYFVNQETERYFTSRIASFI